jgi:hypothetical protein
VVANRYVRATVSASEIWTDRVESHDNHEANFGTFAMRGRFDSTARVTANAGHQDNASSSGATATLESSLRAYSFSAAGSASGFAAGWGWTPQQGAATAHAQSVFDVVFNVSDPTDYDFSGSLESLHEASLRAFASVELFRDGVLFLQFTSLDDGPSAKQWALSGRLEPGTYDLVGRALFDSEVWQAYSNGDYAQYSLSLELQHGATFAAAASVPDGGSTALLLCGALGSVAAGRRLLAVRSHERKFFGFPNLQQILVNVCEQFRAGLKLCVLFHVLLLSPFLSDESENG